MFALNPQNELRTLGSNFTNWDSSYLGLGQWWSLHKTWCLDVLEGSFTLNLIILATTTMIHYVSCSGNQLTTVNQLAVGYTSVSITLATFIGILAYLIFQQLRHTKLWKEVPKLNLKFNRRNIVEVANEPADNLTAREDFSRLRESLLEDLS